MISLHDRDARPIVRGQLGRPVEFGYKAQVVDNEDGVILDHTVEQGNPADAPQLAPAITRITRRAGRPPRTVAADRRARGVRGAGYLGATIRQIAAAAGVDPALVHHYFGTEDRLFVTALARSSDLIPYAARSPPTSVIRRVSSSTPAAPIVDV